MVFVGARASVCGIVDIVTPMPFPAFQTLKECIWLDVERGFPMTYFSVQKELCYAESHQSESRIVQAVAR